MSNIEPLKRLFILIGLLCMLSGCEHDIQVKLAREQPAYVPLSIPARISTTENVAGAISAEIVAKYNQAVRFPVDVEAVQDSSHSHVFNITGLPPGIYRLFIEAPYDQKFAGLVLYRSHLTTYTELIVHETIPYHCFGFDIKDKGVQGWTTGRIYSTNKSEPVSNQSCPGLFFVEHSWPWSLDKVSAGGSLFVPVSEECFPRPNELVTANGRWYFSIFSPDLSQNHDWQNIRAIQFRVATKQIPISITTQLHYASSSVQELHQTNKNPDTAGYVVNGIEWQTIEVPVDRKDPGQLRQLEIIISGDPARTVGPAVNSIFVDAVCPVTD